jgi:hypothetical protein
VSAPDELLRAGVRVVAFAVEQMGTRKHDGDPGALEVVDRAFEFLGRDWTGTD